MFLQEYGENGSTSTASVLPYFEAGAGCQLPQLCN